MPWRTLQRQPFKKKTQQSHCSAGQPSPESANRCALRGSVPLTKEGSDSMSAKVSVRQITGAANRRSCSCRYPETFDA